MHWFSLSLATALAAALEAGFLKRHFGDLKPFEAALYPMAYCIPFLLVLALATPWPRDLPPAYWGTCALLLPLNIAGMVLQYRALALSPLSLTLPYLAFTPAFTLLAGWAVLSEVPNLFGLAGVLLTVGGCYILNLGPGGAGGLAAPLRAAARDPGSRSMLLAAAAFGLCSVLGRKGILESNPRFFLSSFFLAQAVLSVALLHFTGLARASCLRARPLRGLALGGLLFVHLFCHVLAVSLVKTAYMIAIKRLSAVFGVLLGGLWLGEEGLGRRLAGAGLMVLGAAVIGLLGD